ncbi:unnamed protein product [Camellia sinensis]
MRLQPTKPSEKLFSTHRPSSKCINQMLKLNQPVNSSGTANEEVYMILIYYKFCQDILFPLIYVKDLRKHDVTLYFLIDEDRKPVHDVPTVRDSFMISRAQLGFVRLYENGRENKPAGKKTM